MPHTVKSPTCKSFEFGLGLSEKVGKTVNIGIAVGYIAGFFRHALADLQIHVVYNFGIIVVWQKSLTCKILVIF